MKKMYIIFC